MAEELFVDKILKLLGENPAASPRLDDKWIQVVVVLFFYSLPVIFFLLIIAPFIWIWFKKNRKYTLKNIGLALAQSVGLVIAGLVALFVLAMILQGLAFCELYGC